jgi:hypothetical protein
MKKIIGLLSLVFILNGCAESMALLAPASTAVSGGNAVQSSITSAASYTLKKTTGKSPIEHVVSFAENENPQRQKEKCVEFIEYNSEVCKILNMRMSLLKKKINDNSKINNFVDN